MKLGPVLYLGKEEDSTRIDRTSCNHYIEITTNIEIIICTLI